MSYEAAQVSVIPATRNGLASAQGLSFNETAGATINATIGNGDFSVFVDVNPAAISEYKWIFHGGSNAFGLFMNSGSYLIQSSLVAVGDNTASTGALTVGITSRIGYVKSGNNATYYINGVAAGTTTDSRNYSGATTSLGGTSHFFKGILSSIGIYNRALTAAEVLALYQSGAPAAADYPSSPAGTVVTKTVTLGTWTGSVAGSTYTVSTASTAFINGGLVAYGSLPRGKIRINYNLTINSGPGPAFGDGNAFTSSALVAGTSQSVEFANPSAGNQLFLVNNYAAGNYVVTINSVTVLGLLLAPDSAQVGGGLTWYDASGNAANITLPAEGVSWSLPTSGKAFSLSLASTTAGSAGAGALVVTGGLATGAASYFGGNTTVNGEFRANNIRLENGTFIAFGSADGEGMTGSQSANSLTLRTNSTTALTINSAQAATFAGTVTATQNLSAGNWTTQDTSVIAGGANANVTTFATSSTNRNYLVTVRQDGAASNYMICLVSTYGANGSTVLIAQDNTNPALYLTPTMSGLSLNIAVAAGYGSTTWKTTVTPLSN